MTRRTPCNTHPWGITTGRYTRDTHRGATGPTNGTTAESLLERFQSVERASCVCNLPPGPTMQASQLPPLRRCEPTLHG